MQYGGSGHKLYEARGPWCPLPLAPIPFEVQRVRKRVNIRFPFSFAEKHNCHTVALFPAGVALSKHHDLI